MNEVICALKDASTIILLPHISPDADAIGSCFAMSAALKKQGKACRVILDEPLPSYLDFLEGEWEAYCENEKYDVKNSVCLCIDCGDSGRIGKRAVMLEGAEDVVSIDHHRSNTRYANVNWVEENQPATAALIYKYIKAENIELDSYIATMLYAALCGDTGNFKFSNTTSETFIIASELVKYDIKHWDISRAVFDTEDYNILKLKGYLMQRVELYFDGRVSLVCVTDKEIEDFGANAADVDAVVDIARRVKGSEVAISLKESGGKVKVSLRSAGEADVASVAEAFGGGGHAKAAGFVSDKKIQEAKAELIEYIEKIL